MKNKGNMTPPKEHSNFPAIDPKEIKTLILPGNCFKEAELTTRDKKKKKTGEQSSEIRKATHEQNMFNRETEIVIGNQTEFWS